MSLLELQQIVNEINARTGLSVRQIYESTQEEIFIPLALFAHREFGIMETVVKYLVENKGMRYADIGRMLDKDQRVIAVTYYKAKKKSIYIFKETPGRQIPVKIFSRKRSVLEALAKYCNTELGMTNSEIARLTDRDARNIWSAVNR